MLVSPSGIGLAIVVDSRSDKTQVRLSHNDGLGKYIEYRLHLAIATVHIQIQKLVHFWSNF